MLKIKVQLKNRKKWFNICNDCKVQYWKNWPIPGKTNISTKARLHK